MKSLTEPHYESYSFIIIMSGYSVWTIIGYNLRRSATIIAFLKSLKIKISQVM